MSKAGIKALSLWNPWSEFIKLGVKRFETRSWQTSYRGLVAIHSAKRWTDEEIQTAEALHRQFPAIPLIENPALGAVIGICRLLDCVPTESISKNISAHERAVGGWAAGRFAWELEIIEVFDSPIPTRGEQKLFDWEIPPDLSKNRIAVVGSREYKDLEAVRRYISTLSKDTTIISGGARGVDKAAENAAIDYGLKTVVVNVNTRGLPLDEPERSRAFAQRAAIRNGEVVALAGSVTAFWNLESPGTKDALNKAEKAGKTVLINPNTVVKEDAPKQLVFAGFKSTYDEGAYITALERAKHFSSEGEKTKQLDFTWEWPWLATKKDVWVKAKEGAYKLIPIESEEARSWANVLSGWMYQSETLNLREWLMAHADSPENFIALPCDYVEINQYAIDEALHAVKESDIQYAVIPVEKITFTEATYNPGICLKYLEAGTVKEFKTQTLPMVYRFGSDERYFATNGNHRGIGWLMGLDPNRRAALPVRFCHIPQSLEALQESAIELDDDEAKMEFFADVLREAIEIVSKIKEMELEDELVTA